MGKRIAVVGGGAVGGYIAAHLAADKQDVIVIDAWPEHVEAMRSAGTEDHRHGALREHANPHPGNAYHRGPGACERLAHRHRHRVRQILRHALGHGPHCALPRLRRLRGIGSKQQQRGADCIYRWMGTDGGMRRRKQLRRRPHRGGCRQTHHAERRGGQVLGARRGAWARHPASCESSRISWHVWTAAQLPATFGACAGRSCA